MRKVRIAKIGLRVRCFCAGHEPGRMHCLHDEVDSSAAQRGAKKQRRASFARPLGPRRHKSERGEMSCSVQLH